MPGPRRGAAQTEIVHERQKVHDAVILQERLGARYKLLPDGGRQVIDFSMAGGLMGLSADSAAFASALLTV